MRLGWGDTRVLDFSRPLVMGVINVTPDSFSDGGRFAGHGSAVDHGLALAAAGADLLEVGGESTRPGAAPVALGEELERVVPVIEALARRTRCPIGVDSSKVPVMAAALEAGAVLINDVTALEGDPRAVEFLAGRSCPVVLMHKRGTPARMQDDPRYDDVLAEVYDYLAGRIRQCERHGLRRERLIVDPGIGFGKTTAHNLTLLRHLGVFRGLGVPLLLGVSRKRVVGDLTGVTEPDRRDPGSQALAALGALQGAQILRVHEVGGTRQALAVAQGWRHAS
ncbi:MAG: dihydropteroate synthase [Magnetococcales bacterium]|nr:dihydropteroate synthase [Magnetococcales bacterium]